MKKILVIGAGQSAPYLISYLLDQAERHDWFVTVGDIDASLAQERVGDHPRGGAIRFDVTDSAMRSTQIAQSDVVVNLLSPAFQDLIAWDCVNHGRHMVSASYRSRAVHALDRDAVRKGVLLLCELGLDPGIDHMSAMALIRRIRTEGGRIVSFCSYGSGIPAPDQRQHHLRYVITWNPRNVVMAGEAGAQYMENGQIKIVPPPQVFGHTWPVDVEGIGRLEAYANRDSLSYLDVYGLKDVHTMIRGTLRWPGWSETWAQIVRLGLPNERMRIPNLAERTYREVTEMFLPLDNGSRNTELRLARHLQINRTGKIMDDLRWLGLFSDEKTGCAGDTAAAMMIDLLRKKMPLEPDMTDVVVLVHHVEADYPDQDRPAELVRSTMVERGDPGGFTAMAKTVGLPAAIAAKLLMLGELPLSGALIPTHPSVYEPVMRELGELGIRFRESVSAL